MGNKEVNYNVVEFVSTDLVEDFITTFNMWGVPLTTHIKNLKEEVKELADALIAYNDNIDLDSYPDKVADILKEIQDVQYTLDAIAIIMGLAQYNDEAFMAVHKSNMSKIGENGEILRDKKGKVLKGPNYVAPDMKGVIEYVDRVTKRS